MTLTRQLGQLFGFGPDQFRIWGVSVRQWVWILAILSGMVQVLLSILFAQEFRQNAGDLGIVMQALSNTGGGRFFWTTAPYVHFGTVSLLNIHFSWVYFAIFPFYRAIPNETTLFVIQAAAIALAAVPLQALAGEVSGSPRKGLLVAGLYLLWAPMYVGMPNSFHLEAFLPVLFFTLVLVWYRKQYVLGLCVAVLAGFTIDAAPILAALVGLMFLSYPAGTAIWRRILAWTGSPDGKGLGPVDGTQTLGSQAARELRTFFRSQEVQACLGLIALSVAVFFAMRYLEVSFAAWLGLHGTTLGVARIVGFSLGNLGVNFGLKVGFWVLILATLGFLPLLYPRILIVLLPWIGYTFLEAGVAWYEFSSHYIAIDAVPLFIGLAFGIRILRLSPTPSPAPSDEKGSGVGEADETAGPSEQPEKEGEFRRSGRIYALFGEDGTLLQGYIDPAPKPSAPTSRAPGGASGARATGSAKWAFLVGLLVVTMVVVANLVINPLDPAADPAMASIPGPYFGGSAGPYGLTIPAPPGAQAVSNLANQVTPQGSLIVEPAFYPLVSWDPNAYPYNTAYNSSYVPFNASNLPTYVLAALGGLRQLNHYVSNISVSAWNSSIYGVEGWVQSTRLGSVYLFEKGYTGPTMSFGPVVYSNFDFEAGTSLSAGISGRLGTISYDGASRAAITSEANQTGGIWQASDLSQSLPPGNYTLLATMQTNGTLAACASVSTNASVLRVTANVPGLPPILTTSIPYGTVPCGEWVHLSFTFTLPHPVPQILFHGNRPAKAFPLSMVLVSLELLSDGPPTT